MKTPYNPFRILLAAVAMLGMAGAAHAACTGPAGNAGDVTFAKNYNVMVYCDGANWVSMNGGTGGGASLDPRIGTINSGAYCVANAGGTGLDCNAAAPSSALSGLTDVTLSGLATGQTLTYNGTRWVNTSSTVALTDRITSGTTIATANPTGYISLTTASSTWGYLGSTASYLPNLNTGAISASSILINGQPLTGVASPTNVPSFRVHRNNVNQTVTAAADSKIEFTTKEFDTFNNYNITTNRFTPTVAGTYIFNLGVYCGPPSSSLCYGMIHKNGIEIAKNGINAADGIVVHTTVIVQMNGTTDYVEPRAIAGGSVFNGNASHTHFSGSLLASGNGLAGSGGATALSALTDVTLSGATTGQTLTYNGSAWVNSTPAVAATDRIVSGTASLIANNGTSIDYLTSANATMNMRGGATSDVALQLGAGRTGSGYAYIDLIGDTTHSDYGLRIIRNNTGANADSWIQHNGTGEFELATLGAAPLLFSTNGTERMRINSAGLIGVGQQPEAGIAFSVMGTIKAQIIKTQVNATGTHGANIYVPNSNTAGFNIYAPNGRMVMIPHSANTTYNPLVQPGDSQLNFSGATSETGALVIAPWSTRLSGIRITASTGNVGIGIVTATAPLEVSGTIKTNATVQAGNADTTCSSASDYGKFRFNSATGKAYLCRP